jgi:V8-like Glu-specific endopeptidase
MDRKFQPNNVVQVRQVNFMSSMTIDPAQSRDDASYNFSERVVPRRRQASDAADVQFDVGDQFRSWATVPLSNLLNVSEGGLENIRIDNDVEDKYSAGGCDSAAGGRRLKYIFSPDDRVQISGTASYPWSAAVMIEFNLGSSSYSCSGTLIYKDAVLTAGHCVAKAGVWASGEERMSRDLKMSSRTS